MTRKQGNRLLTFLAVAYWSICGIYLHVSPVSAGASVDYQRFSADDLRLVGDVVCAEARGEKRVGQHAVAWTILNRWKARRGSVGIPHIVKRGGYAKTCGDAYSGRRGAFLAAYEVLSGRAGDPTFGATHFFAPDRVPVPAWAQRCDAIGKHWFCLPHN